MEKLKALLNTEETAYFIETSGSKLLGEFAKKYPISIENLQAKRLEIGEMPEEKEDRKREFNRTIEVYAEFYERMFPIIADFFVKTLEIKEKEKLPEWSSPTSLIASRVLQLAFGLGAMIIIDDVMKDPKSKANIISPFIELTPEKLEQYQRMYALKHYADLMSSMLSNIATDMLADITKTDK